MTAAPSPKVTVYIPCHDYARYLPDAFESVRRQTYAAWELIIIDDGSTDDTAHVADRCATLEPERVRVVTHPVPRGVQTAANTAIDMARGEYVMRLDADDFLDENALLVMANYLDAHPDVALVYPNYMFCDERGEVLAVELRKKIGTEAGLLDLPPHGACTMVRRRILKSIGGYSEQYDAQDGHELWLKILHRYPVANVTTPLFYYRQHSTSLSRDEDRLLSARRRIKRGLAERHEGGGVRPRIVAVVPAKNTYQREANVALEEFAGRPLIDYTLEAALNSKVFDTVFVSTDDQHVVDHCSQFEGVLASVRPEELSGPRIRLSEVLYDAVLRLEREYEIYPDVVVLLNVHCPLRRADHIREAVDTLLLYNVDNVISVFEDYDLHFTHGEHGLVPLNKGMLQRLRLEREALYIDNGSINALWRENVSETNLYGRKIGHIVTSFEESFQIRSPLERWIASEVIHRDRTRLDETTDSNR